MRKSVRDWVVASAGWSTLLGSARQHPSGRCAQERRDDRERRKGNGQGLRAGKGQGVAQELSRRGINRDVASQKGLKI